MHKILPIMFLIIQLASCQRRITNGSTVDDGADTSFVVYILKADDGIPGWLCGGCIIHPSIVLTSASCLETGSKKMYVIAGYLMYVKTKELDQDKCTKHMKKRIRSYCINREYATPDGKSFTNDELKFKWTKYDIGIARTSTPIDYFDSDYLKYCSYLPSSANVNYNSKYEESPANVVIFGWGHSTYYRPYGDLNDYNERHLRYASSIVLPRLKCRDFFENDYIKDRVGNNFICADGEKGRFDSRGEISHHSKAERAMCKYNRRTGDTETVGMNRTNCSEEEISSEPQSNNDTLDTITLGHTRRNGICQNDHGSPLVLWIGGRPYVVGVASAFLVNKRMQCVGPYLYTSVSCTSLFIHCILREQNTIKLRRSPSICDESDNQRGFKMEETNVDWDDDFGT